MVFQAFYALFLYCSYPPNLGSGIIDETVHYKALNKIYFLKTKCYRLIYEGDGNHIWMQFSNDNCNFT